MCSNNLRQSILGVVGNAALRRPLPRNTETTPIRGSVETILDGTFYEIDHSKLPRRTPAMLHFVRAVMVTAKSEQNVTVRYPSAQSLEAYFGNLDHVAPRKKLYLELDEKFIMGSRHAVDVLKRQIPSQGFEKLRHSKSFWLIKPLPVTCGPEIKYGPIYSNPQTLNVSGLGYRKKAAYAPSSTELDDIVELKSATSGEVKSTTSGEVKCSTFVEATSTTFAEVKSTTSGEINNTTPGDSKQSVKEEDCQEKVQETTQYSRKRKSDEVPNQSKKIRRIPKQKTTEVKAKINENDNKGYIDRWALKRYEAAGLELVEVLKKYGATHGKPISRYQLRTEVRKRIGDTGLLDHMLKHLADQVVPRDGNDRLRRRCDSAGMMEYWLESADLVNIRKEAGVKDPYWIPPPGWKLGDCISVPMCLCRQEVKMLKDKLSIMKRQVAELKAKDEDEQPITVVIPVSEASYERETYEVLMKKKRLMEVQLHQISKALMELEEDKNVQSNIGEAAPSLQLMPSAFQSLPVEEMNRDLEEEEAGELSNSHDQEAKESRANRLILKLKPCRQLDNISNSLSQEVDHSMALTSASGSPLSTTTS